MESQISERKQLIAKRKRQFFALVLGVLIAVMPAVSVMAETVTVRDNGVGQNINGKAVYPGEQLKWNITNDATITSGRILVNYWNNGAPVDEELTPSDTNKPGTAQINVKNSRGIADLDH